MIMASDWFQKRHNTIHTLDRLLGEQLQHLCKCIDPAYDLQLKAELHDVRLSLQRFHDALRDLHAKDMEREAGPHPRDE